MLLDFSIKNFGPFKENTTLSMQATKNNEHEKNKIYSKIAEDGLLSSAVIFGPNSSGKTYLLNAIKSMIFILKEVHSDNYIFQYYEPFRLSNESLNSPVELEIRLIIDGILYDYSISYYLDSIDKESLFYYPKGRKNCIFCRDVLNDKIKTDISREVCDRTTVTSALLTVASNYNYAECSKVRNEIMKILVLNSRDMDFDSYEDVNKPEFKRILIDALQAADFAISGITVKDDKDALANLRSFIPAEFLDKMGDSITRTLFIEHDFDTDVDKEQLEFPIDIESDGTKQMIFVMQKIIRALNNGSTIMIDEFGSKLHPLLTRWIIELFSSDDNPNGSQLIVNTHDLSLMDIKKLLRRDQIYFTNKNHADGSSDLYSLADFKGVRKDMDVLGAYLEGRYDAVPIPIKRSVIYDQE